MTGGHPIYRFGLVGCGGRGRGLGRYVAGVEDAQLVAVADLAPDRLELARAELGDVATYPDHVSMLAEANLDVVLLGTTGEYHAAITRDATRQGVRGIYCEKPIACSLADADQMIADCAAAGTVLVMGHQRRWMPQILEVRDAIRAGAIGRLTHGSVYWPSGRIGSNGTHFFDSIAFMIDSQPVEVVGRVVPGIDTTRVDDHPVYRERLAGDPGAFGYITYASGVRLALDCISDVLLPYTYTFCGTKGWITLCEVGWTVDYRARDEDGRAIPHGWLPLDRRDFPALSDDTPGDAERAGYRELIRCIETGVRPTSSGEDGRAALETIAAFHHSSAAGMQPVALPLPHAFRNHRLTIH
jgi:predicted dehydrogenase